MAAGYNHAMSNILEALSSEIEASGAVKSSHWSHHTKVGDGFGVAHRGGRLNNFWHWSAQRFLHPGDTVFTSREYSDMRDWCRTQGRALNMDSLRHVFTHRLLNELVPDARVICVIGDGQANFTGPALYRPKQGQKLVSVNLPEVLIADQKLLLQSGVVSELSTAVARTREEFEAAMSDPGIVLILVPANHAEILKSAGVDLFVNIASFQEMTPALVAEYFDIVKSNHATLYCCNREEKVLYGGERLVFDEYPWENGERLLWEPCPWHQHFYAKRPPFVRAFDGPFTHALVRFPSP